MTQRQAAHSDTIKVRSTDDGLHLANSILWFDSHLNGDLSFLSSATTSFRTQVPHVIATEETVKILEAQRKHTNALICQYNRPFSIGRLSIELLPSGNMLGGASMFVETDEGSLLYAPQIQLDRIPTVRQAQLRRADTLVLGAKHPDPNVAMPNRKKERDRLLSKVRELVNLGKYPIILCHPIAIAQELTYYLSEANLPVAVHNSIFRINRVYETYGANLGNYTLHSPKRTKQKVLLFPYDSENQKAIPRTVPDGPLLLVEETLSDRIDFGPYSREIKGRFYLSTTCDGPQIKEVISQVKPKDLYVFGIYTKIYVDQLQSLCNNIYPLFKNDQPTLF